MSDIQKLSQEDFILVQQLSNALMIHTEVLDDRRKFKGLLFDLLPSNRIEANILLQMYDLGYIKKIMGATEPLELVAYRLSKRICNEYGTSKSFADKMAVIWIECYKKINKYKDSETCKDIEIVFVIENSKAMCGEKIGAVNNAIQSRLADIKYTAINQNRKCDVSFITFAENADFEYSGGNLLEDFFYDDISTTENTNCNLGKAIKHLTESINAFRYAETSINPIFAFILASTPTDNYINAWKEADETAYFKNAPKILYTIGNEIDNSLTDFTDIESVLPAQYLDDVFEKINELVKFQL